MYIYIYIYREREREREREGERGREKEGGGWTSVGTTREKPFPHEANARTHIASLFKLEMESEHPWYINCKNQMGNTRTHRDIISTTMNRSARSFAAPDVEG